jgi:hypothetical protein
MTNRKRPTNRKAAEEYVELVTKCDCPCVYGHFNCAAWDNGPCSDELTGEFKLLEEEETQ